MVEPSPPPVAVRSAMDLAALARNHGNHGMLRWVETALRPVSFDERSIRFEADTGAPRFFARKLQDFLNQATGESWAVEAVDSGGGPTLQEIRRRELAELEANVLPHPKFLEMLEILRKNFPTTHRSPTVTPMGNSISPPEDRAVSGLRAAKNR